MGDGNQFVALLQTILVLQQHFRNSTFIVTFRQLRAPYSRAPYRREGCTRFSYNEHMSDATSTTRGRRPWYVALGAERVENAAPTAVLLHRVIWNAL
jgi:hypothetical protein